MTEENQQSIDTAEISEEIIITNIIKSRRKELTEKFEKNKKRMIIIKHQKNLSKMFVKSTGKRSTNSSATLNMTRISS